MSTKIPNSHKDLLEKPVHVALTTVMPDGQPQSSVVWWDYDGENVLINTARGRQKDKNLSARPIATLLAVDPQNPYRYMEIRGQVTEATEEGAVEHISKLAKKYRGVDQYYGGVAPAERANIETRVIYKIKPMKVLAFGG